jgi:hypothetical protein
MAPFKLSEYNDNIELATRWWSDYPNRKYTDMARPLETFNAYIGDVWNKPKKLMRSASYTNLTYVREAEHDYPIHRAPSISSLAPSLALPYHYRNAERIVHTAPVYKPKTYDWFNIAYAPARYNDTHEAIRRPLKKVHDSFDHSSSHVPYYTMQTKRIFFEQRRQPSYLRGSQQYLDRYVSARLRADDYAQRFVHTAYEAHRPQDYKFNRHFMLGSSVNVPVATSIPHSYLEAQALRRLYKLTGRFYF